MSRPRFASAISERPTASAATDAVCGILRETLGPEPVDLLVAFVTPAFHRELDRVIATLRRRLTPRALLGSVTTGVLGDGKEVEGTPAVTALAGRLPGVRLDPFSYDRLGWPAVGTDAAALRGSLLGDPDREDVRLLLLLADPFSAPMVRLLPAINDALPGVPVVGGMVSGADRPTENRLVLDGEVLETGAVGLAISGPARVDCAVSQGCKPIGDAHLVTRGRHHLIQELGRRPVTEVVRETLDRLDERDRASFERQPLLGRVTSEYKERFGRGDFLVRNILGTDADSGSIAVHDAIRVGQTVQFHIRDRRTAEEDLRLLLDNQTLHGPPAAVFTATCDGRGVRLFGEPHMEPRMIRERVGPVPHAGFFAAGEIGPVGGRNFLHGLTSSMAVFREVE